MAKKKRRPHQRDATGRERSHPSPESLPVMPDPRVVEAMMRQFAEEADQAGPPGKAGVVMLRAYQEQAPGRRVELARQALAIWPDCADAYVLLAEHTKNRTAALQLYEQGVAAGRRALGEQRFQESAGHFWSDHETRPYMRARLGLAFALWNMDRREEAVPHVQEMLELNPDDHQGVRYSLAEFLLKMDRTDDVAQLLRRYPEEDSTTWAYTKALVVFRQEGDTSEARRLLELAKKANKHVPSLLLGRKALPAEPPQYYSPGHPNEAIFYTRNFLPGWRWTAGALAWLRANDDATKKRLAGAPRPKGPLSIIKKWLNKHLPLEHAIWQADARRLPVWVKIADDKIRPWTIIVTSRSANLVLATQTSEDKPTAALLWDTLVQAMQHPAAGAPSRPAELQVDAKESWLLLKPHLEEIGVRLATVRELDLMDILFADLHAHVGGKAPPGLLDVPGVRPEHAGSFYDAAAGFFNAALWKKIGDDAAIKVACDQLQSGPWYAVVMGQSGLTLGLALYEDLAELRRSWAKDIPEEQGTREMVVTSLLFEEEFDIPLADLEAAERFGWSVARSDAYPVIWHKERGLSTRPPLSWELSLMEGILRVLPDFAARHAQADPSEEHVAVAVGTGQLQLRLSWAV